MFDKLYDKYEAINESSTPLTIEQANTLYFDTIATIEQYAIGFRIALANMPSAARNDTIEKIAVNFDELVALIELQR